MTGKVGLIARQVNLAEENLKLTPKDPTLRVGQLWRNVLQQQIKKQDQKQLVGKKVEKKQQLVDPLGSARKPPR